MNTKITLALLCALLIGALARDVLTSTARADAPPAFDRTLVERLVRAQEQSARALDEIRRATERCSK